MTDPVKLKAVAEAIGLKVMPWLGVWTNYEGGPNLECPVDEYGDLTGLHGFVALAYLDCDGIHGANETAFIHGHESWCYKPVANWLEDLPACMRDLWPWLMENTEQVDVAGWKGKTGYRATIRLLLLTMRDPIQVLAAPLPVAICNAVLAVSEKLKEQGDD